MKKDSELYDATEAYVKQVRPAIKQLLDLCDQHGVQLFGMTTYAIAETACHCGRPQCDGTGIGFKCDTFGVCESPKMSELQLAIMALAKLPDELQRQLIDAIITVAAIADSGATVEVGSTLVPVVNAENESFQAEVRRMQSVLRKRGGWHQ